MIKPSDVAFHTPKDVPYDWAETNFFSLYVPEPNLVAWVYTVGRAGVGAFVSEVSAIDAINDQSIDAVYVDLQQHLPMPAKLEDYSQPNGLSVKTHNEPRDYAIKYKGTGDTELDVYAEGLMDPFDIHDPKMNPLATPEDRNNSGFGSAYSHHFDMTVHIKGKAKIRGRAFDVDCVTLMDHSWGPRNERFLSNMCWINGCFGREYTVHAIFSLDPLAKDWDQFKIANGYVLENGKVKGLKAGKLRASRRGQFPVGYELHATDVDNREHFLVGMAVAQQPWAPYSNSHVKMTQVRWYAGNKIGYGQAQENWAMDRLTRWKSDR